jgi:hypothetical protein
MNAFHKFHDEVDDAFPTGLGVSETYWGFIVRERDPDRPKRQIRQVALLFAGAVMMLVGFGQWLLPGSLVAADLIAIKIAITAVFVGVGGACWHAAGSRTEVEVQVDTALREIRVVARDRRGMTQLIQRVRMSDIDSAYIKPGASNRQTGHLLLQVANSDNPLHLASGSDRELRLLHDRLRNDLRPARERVERRLMRQASEAMPSQAQDQAISA